MSDLLLGTEEKTARRVPGNFHGDCRRVEARFDR